MAGEFIFQSLGTVVRVRSGYAFKSEDMGGVGFPVVKIKNVVPPSVDVANCERVPKGVIAGIPRVERFELQEGDTLIAMTGATVGKVGRFPKTIEKHYLNQRVGKVYLTDANRADYSYLYYVLSQDVYVRQMFGVADGSAQANISGSQIEDLEVPLPPLSEQRAIASVLGALDDKIELNRRMNATLEGMARALFQSWFVDFDPVRAKLDGRSPEGMDAETAALFPAEFEESELGLIPKGWRVACLEEITSVGSGKRPADRCDVLSPECSIPLYGGGGQIGYVSSSLYEKPILITGRVGTLGLIFRTSEPSWPSDNTLIIEPPNGFFDFTYFVLKGFDLITLNRGSTQPLLTQTDLKRQIFVLPVKEIVNAFADISGPIFRQIVSNQQESRTLATLRDTLLPKLLSGNISINQPPR